jgi:5-methylcytosine-specific restriction protein B
MMFSQGHWNGGVRVVLPYSKKSFGVPNNLYVIGTMNTADRSIQLLDTALRRRFNFVELEPDISVIKNSNSHIIKDESTGTLIDLAALLTAINRRIELIFDRDHRIGHSYLLGLSNFRELEQVILNKIIPLLQEYFFDEWEKIQLVLGDSVDESGIPQKRPNSIIDYTEEKPNEYSNYRRIFELPKKLTPNQIMGIYR